MTQDNDIVHQIDRLRQDLNAVVLAHNYTLPEIQDVADFTGDSLGLSRQAAASGADVVVFCGVRFMAETAAVLCRGKTVLHPDPNSGCPMADMITPRQLRQLKSRYPDALVLTYVNSSVEIKAESDLCCTSSNAVAVLESIPADRTVIFVPDRNLGSWAVAQTGRSNVVVYDGFCPVHMRILPEMVSAARVEHPSALVLAHPECRPEVVAMADAVASTGGMLDFVRKSQADEFIICTESGMLHALKRVAPGKSFYPVAPDPIAACMNMKLITLPKLLWCLQDLAPRVVIPDDLAERAYSPISRMLAIG
ncbi:MAG: quinolinate synthase NadA [Planctomycetes bacterium]|nr:quinolinate synthase NadA [Planctomycetota bacterium]